MVPIVKHTMTDEHDGTTSTLRVISVNGCILPNGMRNRWISHWPLCALLYCVLLACVVTFVLWGAAGMAYQDLWFVPLPLSFCFFFLECNVAFLPKGHFVMYRLCSACFMRCLKSHEFKHDRMSYLAKLFREYDIVVMQEVYSARPACLDAGYPSLLARLAAKEGLPHCFFGAGPRYPSQLMGTGLLVLSRYPLVATEQLLLKNPFREAMAATKAMLYARVKLPTQNYRGVGVEFIDVFTLHMTPTTNSIQLSRTARVLGNLLLCLSCYSRYAQRCNTTQLKEVLSFITSMQSKHGNGEDPTPVPCIVAGDFNADIVCPTPSNHPEPDSELALLRTETMLAAGLTDTMQGRWQPTFAYESECVISGFGECKGIADDLVYVSSRLVRHGKCSTQIIPLQMHHPVLTHASDHYGVEVEIDLNTKGLVDDARPSLCPWESTAENFKECEKRAARQVRRYRRISSRPQITANRRMSRMMTGM